MKLILDSASANISVASLAYLHIWGTGVLNASFIFLSVMIEPNPLIHIIDLNNVRHAVSFQGDFFLKKGLTAPSNSTP